MPAMSESRHAHGGHARSHRVTCTCGKLLTGNGRMTHQRSCEPYLEAHGYPLADGVVDGIRSDLRDTRPRLEVPNGRGGWRAVNASDLLPSIRRAIGDVALERRRAGNRAALTWAELRPTLAVAYDAALAEVVLAHGGRRRH